MRNRMKDEEQIAEKRRRILEISFKLFAEHGIDAITMPQIAEASGIGRASLYRYYSTKTDLLVAISAWVWKESTYESYIQLDRENATAAQELEFFLDSFIDLYQKHGDILRYNQFFNVFLATHGNLDMNVQPFIDVISHVGALFHETYLKGQEDKTIRTQIPEKEMFETMLHLMLAAATRYAVGLVYGQKADAEPELVILKSMLLERYTQPGQ